MDGALFILRDRIKVLPFISYPWKFNTVEDGDAAAENSELEKVAYMAQDYAQNISGRFDFSLIYGELNGGQQNMFPAQKSESKASTFH